MTPAHAGVIDDFSSAERWQPAAGSPAPQVRANNGLVFNLPFATDRDRVYWDLDGAWDFSAATAFELEVSCEQPAAMRSLAVYLRSGQGWYVWSKPLGVAGRQKLVLRKGDFQTEGTPGGWNAIDKIRLSPWKGQAINASLLVHGLTTRTDRLFIVQATTSAPNNTERAVAKRTTERISDWLQQSGIGHAVITDDELAKAAANASIIILPYNPQPSAASVKALDSFVKRGGKLLVFYSSSERLAALMQVKLEPAQSTRDIARWRAMQFNAEAPPGVPESIHQQSWNIGPAKPATKKSRVIARWANAAGQTSREAAVIATPHGYWFTHILLDDDTAAKRRLLTALLGSLDESIWKDAADHARLHAGRIDSWPDLDQAITAMTALARQHPDRETIVAFQRRARHLQKTLLDFYTAGRYRDATLKGYELSTLMMKAYAMVQRPAPGEFRAVWDHDATGWFPGDWDRTAAFLKNSGINVVFVNATWAGLAHYASEYVPSSFTFANYGDQLAQAIKACRKHGLEIHAWLVCWTLENSREELTKPLLGGERLQHDAKGKEKLWMNPAHPANRRHHFDLIREILASYDVDGIHLDYIRYPGGEWCYSAYTRQRFEAETGIMTATWPADVLDGGRHQDTFKAWRASVITSFVRETRELVRAQKPGTKLSAAVWGGYPQIISSIGQDWGAWIKEDLLDFVTPMNYANDLYRFTALLDQQLQIPGARGRIYPGIGVTANESRLSGDQVVEQILALRQRGMGGFALFDLSQTLVDETLPTLRLGITRP